MSAIDDLPRDPSDSGGSFSNLTEREITELFFAISEQYRPSIGHWTIGARAAEHLRSLGYLQPDPEPEPVKAKTFDEWISETSALLEECAEMRK